MNQDDTDSGKEFLGAGLSAMGGAAVAVAASLVAPTLDTSATIGVFSALVPAAADVISRSLSKSETRRVENVKAMVTKEIRLKIAGGCRPRSDGFFDKGINGQSSAGEIFEGVLHIARSQYEEDKLSYLAYLCASIAFDSSVSRGEANRLIRQVESLSYRKICILAAIHQKPARNTVWRAKCFNLNPGSDELAGLMQECFELEAQGLVRENYDQSPKFGMHAWEFVVPIELRLTALGNKLVNLAQLSEVRTRDWGKIDEVMSAQT